MVMTQKQVSIKNFKLKLLKFWMKMAQIGEDKEFKIKIIIKILDGNATNRRG